MKVPWWEAVRCCWLSGGTGQSCLQRGRGRGPGNVTWMCVVLAGREWAKAEGSEAGAAVQGQGQLYPVRRGRQAGRGLRAAGCGLRAAGCGLRALGSGLRAPGCGLRAPGPPRPLDLALQAHLPGSLQCHYWLCFLRLPLFHLPPSVLRPWAQHHLSSKKEKSKY